jgi:hypothetical protein
VSHTDRIIDLCHLLAPHRQQLVFETAAALLEMQTRVETAEPRGRT